MIRTLLRKIYTLFHEPNILLRKFIGSCFFNILPDELALKMLYKSIFGKKLDLKNPQTFNEKLQWLKLYNRKPEYTTMVDKYAVKKYVADIIGEEYIIPTLGVWEKFDDINFDSLPNQFVLKTTHGSGDIVICKDKEAFDKIEAKKKLTKALKTDYYKIGREWPYKNVPRRIIAEPYIQSKDGGGLNDYKFFVFGGVPHIMFVATDREKGAEATRFDFFDMNFNHLNIENIHPNSNQVLDRPIGFEKMILLAKQLSKNEPFLRVDFYQVEEKIYFGELTLFHAGGCSIFKPSQWDQDLGDLLQLPL